jgi:hypothetical protein
MIQFIIVLFIILSAKNKKWLFKESEIILELSIKFPLIFILVLPLLVHNLPISEFIIF